MKSIPSLITALLVESLAVGLLIAAIWGGGIIPESEGETATTMGRSAETDATNYPPDLWGRAGIAAPADRLPPAERRQLTAARLENAQKALGRFFEQQLDQWLAPPPATPLH